MQKEYEFQSKGEICLGTQTQKGKAFEYACLQSLYNTLNENQEVLIEENSALNVAKKYFNNLDLRTCIKMNKGANAAVSIILQVEPQLQNPFDNKPLILSIQEDSKGITGDVRDILCIRRQNNWEIGLSCKHNHTAIKHSRLSDVNDFGESWFSIPCSKQYFDDIIPIFSELRKMKKHGIYWRDIKDKEKKYYIPILQAFINELNRLDVSKSENIPESLLKYLLGNYDFYKIITIDSKKTTQVQCFNINGTLNRNAGKVKPLIKIPKLPMPYRIFDISFKPNSNNTIIITLDNGWTISMRIHNASSLIEPSLKFDAQLTGVPPVLYSHFQAW